MPLQLGWLRNRSPTGTRLHAWLLLVRCSAPGCRCRSAPDHPCLFLGSHWRPPSSPPLPRLREVVRADALRPVAAADLLLAVPGRLQALPLLLRLKQPRAQHLEHAGWEGSWVDPGSWLSGRQLVRSSSWARQPALGYGRGAKLGCQAMQATSKD